MRTLLALLCGVGLVLGAAAPTASAQDTQAKPEKPKKDKKPKTTKGKADEDVPLPDPKNTERDLNRLVKDLQFALEGGSSRGFLGYFDSAKFDDYPRFEDMVERLMRQDNLRVNFRTAFTAPAGGQTPGKSQMTLDGDMELSRKDGVGQVTRRRNQMVVEFTYTKRGWRITNLTPRDYFQPY